MVKNKQWIPLESDKTLADLLSALRDLDPEPIQDLLTEVFTNFENMTETGQVSSRSLVRIYLSYMCLYQHLEMM